MSTEFFNDQWRIPSNENQNKISNYSMEFDGTSDRIEFGNINGFEITDSFSGSCWVNLDTLGATYFITKQLNGAPYTGYIFYIGATNKLQLYFSGTGGNILVVSNETLSVNTWYNLAFTYDGSNSGSGVKMYINAIQTTNTVTNTGTITTILNAAPFQVSGRGGANSSVVDGRIDQVNIFDYALSQAQVSQLGAAEGYAFNFDGVDDKITISGATDLTINGDLTMSMWFKARSFDDFEYIFRLGSGTVQNGDRMIGFKTSKISTNTYADSSGAFNVLGNTTLSTGVWYHVAIVYSSNTVIIYLNGDADSASITTTMGTISYVTTTIGESYNGLDFAGEVSNAQIFNSVIPPTGSNSIKTIYNNGKPLTNMSGFTSLQGWWKLDNTATLSGSTWSIPDASTNSNPGTSSGMTASSLVGTNINGELVGNPMGLSPKPVSYYQLGDQSVDNVANFLVPNNSLQDYVFQISPSGAKRFNIPSLPIASAATISIWFNPITLSNGTLFGNADASPYQFLRLTTSGGNVQVIYYGSSGGTLNTNITVDATFLNKWHHIALVQNGGTATVYIDNVSKGAISGGLKTPSFISIGAMSTGGSVFNGFVSNAATFTTNLPATGTQSIASLYNNGSPPDLTSYSNLQRWYKLNAADTFNGTNWTIKDYAGSSNGTSVFMTSANLVVSDLQHTSGYSPYALDFGGITAFLKTATIPAATNKVTLSAWVKRTGAAGDYAGVFGIRNSGGSPSFGICWDLCFLSTTNKIEFRIGETDNSAYIQVTQNTAMVDNTWTHVVGVADGTNAYLYINGVRQTDTESYDGTLKVPTSNIHFAAQGIGAVHFNGQLSNCARWNIDLTQAQITEIYNQGVPSNLNTFSGTAPIGWWQLGSNSSFQSNAWTCLDEINIDNADSASGANMTNDDIVNGPGYSSNGLGTSSIDINGDAPYSAANGLSENMDVLDRTKSVPG